MSWVVRKQIIKDFYKAHKTEIIIFGLAFGVRFFYSLLIKMLVGESGFSAYSDSETFLRVAHNILDRGVMSQMTTNPFIPDSLRTPLYPLFLSFFLWLNLSLWGMATIQNILAGLSAVMLYRLGDIWFKSSRAGLITAIIFSFNPISIYWNSLLMSDNLFSFFLIGAFYFLSRQQYYWFAVWLGLSALTRPVGLYFLPIFLLIIFWKQKKHFNNKLFKKLILVVVIVFLTISPWMIRNKLIFNTWQLSSAGWLNLYLFSLGEFASEYNFHLPVPIKPDNYPFLPGPDEPVFNYDFMNVPFYQKQAIDIISKYPFEYIKFHLYASLKTLNYHGYEYLVNYVVRPKLPALYENWGSNFILAGQAIWWLFYLIIIGAFIKSKYRIEISLLVMVVLINNILLGYSGISQGGRYSMPVEPIILLAVGYGISEAFNHIKSLYVRYKRI